MECLVTRSCLQTLIFFIQLDYLYSLWNETQNNLEPYVCTPVQTRLILVYCWEQTRCCCSNKPLYNLNKTEVYFSLRATCCGWVGKRFYSMQSSGDPSLLEFIPPSSCTSLCSLSIRLSQRLENYREIQLGVTHITSSHVTLARTSHVVLSNWWGLRKCRGALHLCHR